MDDVLRVSLTRALSERAFAGTSAASFEQALAFARREPPVYALLDLQPRHASGLELVRELRALDPAMRIAQPSQHRG
jgi:ActR/RegA family two-component response regulator